MKPILLDIHQAQALRRGATIPHCVILDALTEAELRADQDNKALKCSDEMKIKASQYRQMGFPALARDLEKNADAALKWAARK